MMIPLWLTILAWSVTGIGLLCAVIILADIYLGGYRQPMTSWEAVWPITAIYAGPLALVVYYRWGRPGHGAMAKPSWCRARPELGRDGCPGNHPWRRGIVHRPSDRRADRGGYRNHDRWQRRLADDSAYCRVRTAVADCLRIPFADADGPDPLGRPAAVGGAMATPAP